MNQHYCFIIRQRTVFDPTKAKGGDEVVQKITRQMVQASPGVHNCTKSVFWCLYIVEDLLYHAHATHNPFHL